MPSISHWPAFEAFCKKHNLGFLPIRFRLRTLLFFTTLLAVALGFVANVLIHIRRQSAIAARIETVGGQSRFQNYLGTVYGKDLARDEWSRKHFGEHTFRHIKHVHLLSLQPRDEVLALLPQLSRLEGLQVSGKNFTAENLLSIVQCRRLQTLDMHLSGVESASIAELRRLPVLRQLKLANFEAERVREIATLPQLESVTIHSRHTTPAALAELRKLPKLKRLEIDGCADADHETCAALIGLDRLEELSLREIPLNSHDFRQLAKLPSLRRLNLAQLPSLDVEGASALRKMVQLQWLGIWQNCSDEILAELASMPELETLYVVGNNVTAASVPTMLQFPKIKHLGINGTAITVAGLQELALRPQVLQIQTNLTLTSEQQQAIYRSVPGRAILISP